MKNIACAILSVGLCFYSGYLKANGREQDVLADFFALIAAICVFLL